ncbi:MAG TPA: hypothetical protein VGG10_11365 [Rhizomicrobium sp.]|jgi:hypothetical protein
MHRNFENMYVFGYLFAGLCAILIVMALLTGSSILRGGESVRRDEEPRKYWIGVVLLFVLALLGAGIGFFAHR